LIYNLVKYLVDGNPGLSYCANGFKENSPDDCTSVNEGQGIEQSWYNREDITIQVVSRALKGTTARINNKSSYNLIKKKYGLTLPEVTVESVVYPAVKTWAIRPVTTPTYIGDDENGRPMYTFNVEITLQN